MCVKQMHHWISPTCSGGKRSVRVIEIKTVGYCSKTTNVRTSKDPEVPSEWQLLLEALPLAQQIDPNQIYKLEPKPQTDRQDCPTSILAFVCPFASQAPCLTLLWVNWRWQCHLSVGFSVESGERLDHEKRNMEHLIMGSHCYSPNPGSSTSLPLGTSDSSCVK